MCRHDAWRANLAQRLLPIEMRAELKGMGSLWIFEDNLYFETKGVISGPMPLIPCLSTTGGEYKSILTISGTDFESTDRWGSMEGKSDGGPVEH